MTECDVETLKIQLVGGKLLPTHPDHVGCLLLKLGWKYVGPDTEEALQAWLRDPSDTDACFWEDPFLEGSSRVCRTLPHALEVSYRRLLSYCGNPTRLDFVLNDD